jgi:hypothetical protein
MKWTGTWSCTASELRDFVSQGTMTVEARNPGDAETQIRDGMLAKFNQGGRRRVLPSDLHVVGVRRAPD